MDLLQLSLSILVLLLCVFLTVIGIQVFLILKDLKKALDKLNVEDIERPIESASNLITTTGEGVIRRAGGTPTYKKKRFYKKVL